MVTKVLTVGQGAADVMATLGDVTQASTFRAALGITEDGNNGVTVVSAVLPITSSGGGTPTISINNATPTTAGAMSAVDKTKLDTLTSGSSIISLAVAAPITTTGGINPTIGINTATSTQSGVMSATDKAKLDGITAGAGGGVAGVTGVTGTSPIVSTGGTAPVISIIPASTLTAGTMSVADKIKLDGIANGAGTGGGGSGTLTSVTGTAPIASSGGNAPVISISNATPSVAGAMSAADKTKLDSLGSSGASAEIATAERMSTGNFINDALPFLAEPCGSVWPSWKKTPIIMNSNVFNTAFGTWVDDNSGFKFLLPGSYIVTGMFNLASYAASATIINDNSVATIYAEFGGRRLILADAHFPKRIIIENKSTGFSLPIKVTAANEIIKFVGTRTPYINYASDDFCGLSIGNVLNDGINVCTNWIRITKVG